MTDIEDAVFEEVGEVGQIAVRQESSLARADEMTVDQMIEQVQKIQAVMERVMQDGTHYGVIPGTDKPTLYKPGAEKLCLLFRLDPEYDITETRHEDGHLDVLVTCTLFHIPTGNRVASGVGFCSTRETKYAYRKAERVCPNCGEEAIIKGKAEYGGGWLCWARKGGCGTKFPDGDSQIEGQETGRKDNPDLPDTFNTVIKMGCKRALTAAVLNGTAASDIFTQDMEDFAATVPEPQTQQTMPTDPLVTTDTLGVLLNEVDIASAYSTVWMPETVLANASRQFGRQVEKFADLTEPEAQRILTGARAFVEKSRTADAEDIPFG